MKQFKTESKRILDLMINSIYTNKEIFLRELISNASDAIDKLHFISLTDDKVDHNFRIYIGRDKDAGRAAELKRGVLAHGLAHEHVGLAGNSGERAEQVLVEKVILVHTNIRLMVVVFINRMQYTPPGWIWCKVT